MKKTTETDENLISFPEKPPRSRGDETTNSARETQILFSLDSFPN
jgi:hypothetical protein